MRAVKAGDVVKAPATDRFARDPTDLLVLGRDIRTRGARFVSIAEPIVMQSTPTRSSGSWSRPALALLRRIRERTAGRPGCGQGAGGEVRP